MKGLHRYFGLATAPSTELPTRLDFPILSTLQHQYISMSRSQVRGQTNQQHTTSQDRSAGTRVGRDSMIRPGIPLGMKDMEFMVSPTHKGIKKKTLRKAITAASGQSMYRGKLLSANVDFRASSSQTLRAQHLDS